MTILVVDGEEIIPYTVWGNTEKVVLRVPTELQFHGKTTEAKSLKVAITA